MNKKLKILFVCTRNSCRSQMAEGWTKHFYPDLIDAKSAGIEKNDVDPLAVQVMAESGVDISQQRSKLIQEMNLEDFHFLITLCDDANQNCPHVPENVKRMHKSVQDPQQFKETTKDIRLLLPCYRHIRDQIKNIILDLPKELELT